MDCCICLSKVNDENQAKMLQKKCSCKYIVHEICIKKWLLINPVCPYCKVAFGNANEVILTVDNDEERVVADDRPVVLLAHHYINTNIYGSNMILCRLLFFVLIIVLIFEIDNIFKK